MFQRTNNLNNNDVLGKTMISDCEPHNNVF